MDSDDPALPVAKYRHFVSPRSAVSSPGSGITGWAAKITIPVDKEAGMTSSRSCFRTSSMRPARPAISSPGLSATWPVRLGSGAQFRTVATHFALDLVEPGVVPIQQWRPDHSPFDPPKDLTNLGGVARKALCRLRPGVIMNCPEIRDGQAGQALGYEQAGPMAVRMLLGARLRKLREAAGVSRVDAGRAIRASESKMSRLELGRSSFKPRDVSGLLDLYRVGADERATLLAMAGACQQPWLVAGIRRSGSRLVRALSRPGTGRGNHPLL